MAREYYFAYGSNPEIKGFHGLTDHSGRAVKALDALLRRHCSCRSIWKTSPPAHHRLANN